MWGLPILANIHHSVWSVVCSEEVSAWCFQIHTIIWVILRVGVPILTNIYTIMYGLWFALRSYPHGAFVLNTSYYTASWFAADAADAFLVFLCRVVCERMDEGRRTEEETSPPSPCASHAP